MADEFAGLFDLLFIYILFGRQAALRFEGTVELGRAYIILKNELLHSGLFEDVFCDEIVGLFKMGKQDAV